MQSNVRIIPIYIWYIPCSFIILYVCVESLAICIILEPFMALQINHKSFPSPNFCMISSFSLVSLLSTEDPHFCRHMYIQTFYIHIIYLQIKRGEFSGKRNILLYIHKGCLICKVSYKCIRKLNKAYCTYVHNAHPYIDKIIIVKFYSMSCFWRLRAYIFSAVHRFLVRLNKLRSVCWADMLLLWVGN